MHYAIKLFCKPHFKKSTVFKYMKALRTKKKKSHQLLFTLWIHDSVNAALDIKWNNPNSNHFLFLAIASALRLPWHSITDTMKLIHMKELRLSIA